MRSLRHQLSYLRDLVSRAGFGEGGAVMRARLAGRSHLVLDTEIYSLRDLEQVNARPRPVLKARVTVCVCGGGGCREVQRWTNTRWWLAYRQGVLWHAAHALRYVRGWDCGGGVLKTDMCNGQVHRGKLKPVLDGLLDEVSEMAAHSPICRRWLQVRCHPR